MKRLLEKFNLPIGFGGAALSGEGGGYGFGEISEDQSIELVKYAFDQGIEVFDSAPIYGFGLSEKRVGLGVKSFREKAFLISKSGVDWHENKRVNMSNAVTVTRKMCEESLRRLDTEYIDLYMIHWPDENIDIRRPMEILANLKNEGKIKNIGLCNTFSEDLVKAMEIERVEVVQSELNPFNISSLENISNELQEHKISFMSWGTLDKGILSKRVNRKRSNKAGFESSDCRSWAPWWKEKDVIKKLDAMDEVFSYLERNSNSGLEFAISHNLSFDLCNQVLIGMKSFKQVDSAIAATKNLMKQDEITEAISMLKKHM